MSKAERILEKMRNNPRDWRIDDLKTVARAHGIEWRQQGSSYMVLVRDDGRTLSVPVDRSIRPVYIRKFVQFVGG